ncbi:hypothetical protein GIB67_004717 [Kingdonia uniflora]|uniref:RNA polymerase Rpb2 domain-containing protein n=1 Tax=Kingdonia uniflora TaxID=39325 RepID=A0A7J7P5C7_9MAGN|nr:hypothetical protein GIB67_004717 [Kingdonia uniflora]
MDQFLKILASECLHIDDGSTISIEHAFRQALNNTISLSQHWVVVHMSLRIFLLGNLTRDVPIVTYDVGLLQAVASCIDALPSLFSFRPNFESVNYQFGATENSIESLTLLVLEEFLHIIQGIFCDSNLLHTESPDEGGWHELVTNGYIEYVDTEEEETTTYDFSFSQTPADVPLQINNKANSNKVEASTNQVAEKQMPVYQLPLKILYRVIDIQLKKCVTSVSNSRKRVTFSDVVEVFGDDSRVIPLRASLLTSGNYSDVEVRGKRASHIENGSKRPIKA